MGWNIKLSDINELINYFKLKISKHCNFILTILEEHPSLQISKYTNL
jgi:hypothetical protein